MSSPKCENLLSKKRPAISITASKIVCYLIVSRTFLAGLNREKYLCHCYTILMNFYFYRYIFLSFVRSLCTRLSREIHRMRCYKIIVQTRVTRMYNASRGRHRRRQWMVEVHPWWRLLQGIVPHLLGYELASSFDLPVISLRLLLPRLLRPSSCHLHRVCVLCMCVYVCVCYVYVSAGNTFLPPSILTRTCPPRPPSPDSSILFRLASLPPLRFLLPSFCIEDTALRATRVLQIFVPLLSVLCNYLPFYWWNLRWDAASRLINLCFSLTLSFASPPFSRLSSVFSFSFRSEQ